MRFENFDLNLLVAFDALLKEGNVSGAARRLHLSQSAMSGTLARLRDYFGDELMVMVGRGMVPTARARELQQPVADALLQIRTSIMTATRFDPAEADRQFTIIASDYLYDIVLADTLRELSAQAPGVDFEIVHPSGAALERFEAGKVDLLITLTAHSSPDHPLEELFSDCLAVICWSENPACEDGVSVETFLSSPHVVPVFGPNRSAAYSELILDQLAVERRISVRVPNFSAIPQALVGTNRLGTMNERHAHHFARTLPLKVWRLPFETPPLIEAMQRHRIRQKDEGVNWLANHVRQQVRRAGLSVEPAAEA